MTAKLKNIAPPPKYMRYMKCGEMSRISQGLAFFAKLPRNESAIQKDLLLSDRPVKTSINPTIPKIAGWVKVWTCAIEIIDVSLWGTARESSSGEPR